MDLISPLIDIIDRLCSCTANRLRYINELEENLNTLRTSMDEVKNTRNDVRRRVERAEGNQMKRTEQVEGWLRRTDAMETEVDEILSEGSKELEERRRGGCCPSHCLSSYKLGKRVVRKNDDVAELLKSKESFDAVAEALPLAPVQEMLVVSTTGMDLMFEKAWSFISEEQVGVFGIYGMGGVGKTTLLKRINNGFLHGRNCDFDVVIWVVVSKEVNLLRIQKDIGNRLKLSSLPEDGSVDERASILYSALSKMKFVLLLDDIWDRVDLTALGIPRPNSNDKSKIIFTTRSEAVCGRMEAHRKIRTECLDWPEAWKLFQEKVGEETLNSHGDILAAAEYVARECAGLPLALITTGRAMASKKTPQEWRHAVTTLKKSASEFSGMGDEVYPLLKFSYDALDDDTIRSCFLYCSLFPEDYSIRIEQLIHYWIGEGFLDGFEDMDEAQNKGYDIIGSLKLACLLESGVDTTEEVKMHDVIHDLALWIGSECGKKKDKVMARAGVNLSEAPRVGKWIETERISLMINNIKRLGDEIPKCPNLLTLIVSQNSKLTKISDGFFQYMNVLRVLDLSETRIKEFPMSIVELVELQYLNLSKTMITKLPQEMRKLIKLKYLNLSYTDHLKIIPQETLSRFSKLQILDLTPSHYGHFSPKTWDGLDYGSGEAIIIEELECLKDLKYLSIIIKNVPSLERFLSSDKFKRCIIGLYIFDIQGPTSLSTPGVFESLTTLTCVQCSELEYMAISRIDGKEGICLPKLHYLRIDFCNALKGLSFLCGAPTLECIEVYNCERLEVICDGVKDGCLPNLHTDSQDAEVKDNLTTFSCLRSLDLENLPELKSICWLSFPSDIKARVEKCPKAPRVENCPKAPLRMKSSFDPESDCAT